MSPILGILLAVFLVLLNGFFVAAEFAIVKVRETRIAELARDGIPSAKLASHAIHHMDAYLSATQLGITLASIGLGWVGEPTIARLLDPIFIRMEVSEATAKGISFAIAFTLVSAAHIVFGELAPKSWAIQKSENVTLKLIYPLHWFYILFKPIIFVLNGFAGKFLKLMGIEPAHGHENVHSGDELRMLMQSSGDSGVLNEVEVELAGRVLGFAEKSVDDVMVPRVDIVALDATRPLSENILIAQTKPFSRYPVYNGDQDDVIGFVHIKDLMKLAPDAEASIESVVRPPMYVPESKALDQMLRDFQREKTHIAIVMDEYGGTSGLVTMENVIEQIVGDIVDEYDDEPGAFQELSSTEWRVSGRTRLADINDKLGINLASHDNDTLAGYVFEKFGRVPRPSQLLIEDDCRIVVEEVHGRRVTWLKIRLNSPELA